MDWALWHDSPASCPGQMEGTLCTMSVQVTVETMGFELGVGWGLSWKGQGRASNQVHLHFLELRGDKVALAWAGPASWPRRLFPTD